MNLNRRTKIQERARTNAPYLQKSNSEYVLSPIPDHIMQPFHTPEPLVPRPNHGYFTDRK